MALGRHHTSMPAGGGITPSVHVAAIPEISFLLGYLEPHSFYHSIMLSNVDRYDI